jgi:hypothetical protein
MNDSKKIISDEEILAALERYGWGVSGGRVVRGTRDPKPSGKLNDTNQVSKEPLEVQPCSSVR